MVKRNKNLSIATQEEYGLFLRCFCDQILDAFPFFSRLRRQFFLRVCQNSSPVR